MQRTASERDQPAETPSTPVESLVKKLTNERIIELKKIIHEEQMEYAKLKEDMQFLNSVSSEVIFLKILLRIIHYIFHISVYLVVLDNERRQAS